MSSPVLSIIQEAIDVPLMDVKNISNLIYSYTVYEEIDMPKEFILINFTDNYLGFQQKRGLQFFFITLINNKVEWFWTCPEDEETNMNIKWLDKYANKGIIMNGIPFVKIAEQQFWTYLKHLAVICNTPKRAEATRFMYILDVPRTPRPTAFVIDKGYLLEVSYYVNNKPTKKPVEQIQNHIHSQYIDPWVKTHQKLPVEEDE